MVHLAERAPGVQIAASPCCFGSCLLIGVAPWQQAQPRAQEPCLCYLRGWVQPGEEKAQYLSRTPFGWWLHVLVFDFPFCFYWDWKLRLENIYPKRLSVTEGSRGTVFCWFLSSKQRVVFWAVVFRKWLATPWHVAPRCFGVALPGGYTIASCR